MATLLVEIGCEELPAAACREAERQLPELCRVVLLGVEPSRILSRPAGSRCSSRTSRSRRPDQWVKGPPVAMREKAAAGFAKRHGVAADELEERDGFLGVAVAGQAAGRGAARTGRRARPRPSRSRRRCAGTTAALRFPRPVRWRSRCSTRTTDRRRALVRPPLHVRARSRSRTRPATRTRCAPRASSPTRRERGRQIVAALDALGEWTDPNGVLAEVVYLVETPVGHRRTLRRALPPAAEPRRRDDDPAPHSRVPARREPVCVRRERRRPGHRARRRRERRRGPARGRLVHVRARRQGRESTRLAERLGAITFFQGARLVRGQDRPAREARRGARRGRGGARGGAAREGRPGVRARAGVPGARGPRRRRVRAARRLPRGGLRRDRRAVPARRRGSAAADRPRLGASSRPRTRSTRSTSRSGSASGRPAPATRTGSGAPRSASTGSPPRATSRSRAS